MLHTHATHPTTAVHKGCVITRNGRKLTAAVCTNQSGPQVWFWTNKHGLVLRHPNSPFPLLPAWLNWTLIIFHDNRVPANVRGVVIATLVVSRHRSTSREQHAPAPCSSLSDSGTTVCRCQDNRGLGLNELLS